MYKIMNFIYFMHPLAIYMKKTLYKITQILNILFVFLTLALLIIVLVKKEWVEIALDWIE